MSVIAELTIPAEDFLLHETLSSVPRAIVAMERTVETPTKQLLPTFSVFVDDFTRFDRALLSDSSVKNATPLYERQWGKLYRAEWTQSVKSTVSTLLETGVTLLAACSREDRWDLRIRFHDDANLPEFHARCHENEIAFDLNRLYRPNVSDAPSRYGVTLSQHRALIAALEAGYYEVPRTVTMTELASDLDISQQALSERLRRGEEGLIRELLTNPPFWRPDHL